MQNKFLDSHLQLFYAFPHLIMLFRFGVTKASRILCFSLPYHRSSSFTTRSCYWIRLCSFVPPTCSLSFLPSLVSFPTLFRFSHKSELLCCSLRKCSLKVKSVFLNVILDFHGIIRESLGASFQGSKAQIKTIVFANREVSSWMGETTANSEFFTGILVDGRVN